MHTDVIISSRYDSLLCWLLRCLLCHSATKIQIFQVVCFFVFFFHSPLEHSSHAGEQHRATGCASWGGSGCAKEHLWYGLPEGGQTRTSTSQWYVCPSRLLQQYVYTSWCFFFVFFTIHGQPALVTVHIWIFYTRNQIFFSLRYVWWASSVDLGSVFSPQNCYAHTPT